jgi:glyoxylase-like metal-dependent hydrolase (beta-lactamase superfamily II)
MAVRVDIVSIGTLSRNRIWGETAPVRTPHATTTLIRASEAGSAVGGREKRILVDPGLPAPALAARLFERTGLRPSDIDIVFLTCFRPAHRDALPLFDKAQWLMSERERDAIEDHLRELDHRSGDRDVRKTVASELALLDRLRVPEDDKLTHNVDLFPLPGYTPGLCGLLVTDPTLTTLVAGDAVPTRDHLLAAQLLPDTFDSNAAAEAMREVYEIADTIVPGHDNWFNNPRHAGL